MTAIQRWYFWHGMPNEPDKLYADLVSQGFDPPQWCKAKDVAELEKLLAVYLETIKDLRTGPTHRQVEALLDHCPYAECMACAAIMCPHKDPMHYHHDGCPSCDGSAPSDPYIDVVLSG